MLPARWHGCRKAVRPSMMSGGEVCWSKSLHMEACWQPNISPHKSNTYEPLICSASNGCEYFLVKGARRKPSPFHPCWWRLPFVRVRVRAHKRKHNLRERKKKKQRFYSDLLHLTRQCSSWWLEAQMCLEPWIDPKLGELVPYFAYFNLVSWFED